MSRRGSKWARKTCAECGKAYLPAGFETDGPLARDMEERGLCYECAFWLALAEDRPEHTEVIGRVCAKVLPMAESPDPSAILGGGGKVRRFIRPDWTLVSSNDVWVVGAVPERFAALFPETIKEISGKAYRSLIQNPRKCKARGCLDRYSCFRYDLSVEAGSGPFNKIPRKWKKGGEHCGHFIDKDEMFKTTRR